MRVSIPGRGIGNQKSDSKSIVNDDKIQPSGIPPHDPKYDMQYGCSRKTGWKTGGCFWNPPAYCPSRILTYGNERWVDVGLCRLCPRHKARTCPAAFIDKGHSVNERIVYDEPSNRKPKRVSTPVADAPTSKRRS